MANLTLFRIFVSFLLLNSYLCQSSPDKYIDFFKRTADTLFTQARTTRTPRPEHQFAVFMFAGDTLDDFVYLVKTRDTNDNVVVVEGASTNSGQQCYPSSDNAINYVVARPNQTHSEEEMLQDYRVRTMYNNFREYFLVPPRQAMLYSWLMPCNNVGRGHNCRQRIVEAFNREPLSSIRIRIVAFNQILTTNREDVNNFINLMTNNNIVVFAEIGMRHPLHTTTPSAYPFSDELLRRRRSISNERYKSFQTCLRDCYGESLLASCVPSSYRSDAVKVFIDQLMAAVKDELGNVDRRKQKAVEWIGSDVAKNCRGLAKIRTKTEECFDACRGWFYSRPFNEGRSSLLEGIYQDTCPISVGTTYSSDANSWWNTVCQSTGRQGILCSKFRRDSVTVGGEFVDRSCARRKYSYSWARPPSRSWDYCCESECSGGRCDVGSGTTGFCGSPGYVTVNGQLCRNDHPCGLHGESYYWCYVDSDVGKSWDYCCWSVSSTCDRQSDDVYKCDVGRADWILYEQCGGTSSKTVNGEYCRYDHPCSTHGEGYYWCYKRGGGWDYCCSPHHQCATYDYSYQWCYTSSDGQGYYQYCKT